MGSSDRHATVEAAPALPWAELEAREPELVITVVDRPSGLRAFIVIDSLTLGPAAGGIRTLAYESDAAALRDAMDLARAMTLKCALGGLNAGGAKAVVMERPGLDRSRAFAALGRRIDRLGGIFRTAGDLGTTAADITELAKHTSYAHPDEAPLVDAVGRGLVRCIETAARLRDRPVSTLTAAVQGVGAIGAAVARALARQGVTLRVADVEQTRARQIADELGATVVEPETVLLEDVDVIVPCARGGVVDEKMASALKAWLLCGAANNIVASASAEQRLVDRDVLYVPDIIASAGAVIDGIGLTVMGLDDRTALIDALGPLTGKVLERAKRESVRPTVAATRFAHERLGS